MSQSADSVKRMDRKIGIIKLPVNRLHIELTNICNFSCEFCPDSRMKRQRGNMPTEMARAIIDEAGREGIAKMVLFHVMGEPVLHPDLVDLSAYAGEKGLDVCITTNGSLMDGNLLHSLQDAGVRQVIVSLQTPDEKTFSMRGAGGISFDEYAQRVTTLTREFIKYPGNMELTISFLSSPLRRLIFPVAEEFSIADTSKDLKRHLRLWAERILAGTGIKDRLPIVLKQIDRVRSFRENTIELTEGLSFKTRILGDWVKKGNSRIVKARFGFCQGLQENFGILYNGDYVFCCTDFDGKTSTANFGNTSIVDYLASDPVQEVVRGFRQFRVIDPYCQECIGDTSYLNSFVKQIGSILYFKLIRGV